jgi:hypothetical protein
MPVYIKNELEQVCELLGSLIGTTAVNLDRAQSQYIKTNDRRYKFHAAVRLHDAVLRAHDLCQCSLRKIEEAIAELGTDSQELHTN